MITIAQIAAALIPDGTYFHATVAGEKVHLDELCRTLGAEVTYRAPHTVWLDDGTSRSVSAESRYVFPDGSALVSNEVFWDLEGAEPWSYAGA